MDFLEKLKEKLTNEDWSKILEEQETTKKKAKGKEKSNRKDANKENDKAD